MAGINNDSFLQSVKHLQDNYYEKAGKNTIFKSSQKNDCAATISSAFDIEQLLHNTVYIINNTNKVYFDYAVFKLYAIPELYSAVSDRILNLFDECIQNYGDFEIHINILSATVSACERHKSIFSVFIDRSLQNNVGYSFKMTKCVIYNPPSAVDMIIRIVAPFMDPLVRTKIMLVSKPDSPQSLTALFSA